MRVYLAGPINGCTDAEANGWRDELKARMPMIEWVSPMVRDYRGREDEAGDAIVDGDLADIDTCPVLVVNAARATWGTAMEAWEARVHRGKYVLTWLPQGQPLSPWLRRASTEIVGSVYEVESRLTYLNAVGVPA